MATPDLLIGARLRAGLWDQNQALVALLGLCPLLAVSTSVVNGLGLGLATTLTLLLTNTVVALLRPWLMPAIRLPLLVLIIAAIVSTIDLAMDAWLHGLHRTLGIFIPLIVTNCIILSRAEVYAAKHGVVSAWLDAATMGAGFTAVLVVLGGLRELLGTGSLFDHAELLFGPVARDWSWRLFAADRGLLLALLPPGAFIGLGLLVALKNCLDGLRPSRSGSSSETP